MGILNIVDFSLKIENKNILENVNMEVEENKVYALVGPNGAGKSTLAFAIMGLEGYRNFSGDIKFKGESITDLSPYERAKKGITLAWQEPARYEGLTVKKFIDAAAKNSDGEKTEKSLEMVGMEPRDYLGREMDSGLSGGERKKIELASILSMDPELVLLDEPDSGIDVSSLDRIFEGIELLKDRGSTVLLITHSGTVLQHAEEAFLMCCGNIIDRGASQEINEYFEGKCIPCNHKNRPQVDEEA